MATKSKTVKKEEMEKQNEIVELTNFAQQQLIEKKKTDLPKFIRKRKKEFIKELEQYQIAKIDSLQEIEDPVALEIMGKKIPMYELIESCFAPFIKNCGIAPQYSAKELNVIFDYFKECIKEMNKKEVLPPTKEMFCSLCGISTERFTEYKNGSSPEIREVCLRVEDFICNYMHIGGLTRKLETANSIFIPKTLGRKEATEPQQVVNNNNLILSDNEFAELLNKYSTKK